MWSRVDDSIPNHPKFLKAGPIASWLWICGNCYCNKHLTDGFIPVEALGTIGAIPNVKEHAAVLVANRLWEITDGGFCVHDFHHHNPQAVEIKQKREKDRLRKRPLLDDVSERIPSGIQMESMRNPDGIQTDSARIPDASRARSQSQSQSQSHPTKIPIPSEELEKRELTQKHLSSADADFERFRTAYPSSRRVGGKTGKGAFKTATVGRNGTHLAMMLDSLEKQKRSEQWQTPKLIPLMTTWLNQERWNQVLPEQSPMGLSPKTAGNLSALQRFANKKS